MDTESGGTILSVIVMGEVGFEDEEEEFQGKDSSSVGKRENIGGEILERGKLWNGDELEGMKSEYGKVGLLMDG